MWRDVQPLVQRALNHSCGEFDSLDILQFLLSQEMRLWVAYDGKLQGIVVTQVVSFPRMKTLQVVLMSGENAFNGWFKEMLDTVESWGRSMGCTKIQEAGRPGWERMERKLKFGYKKGYTVMEKSLVGAT